MMIANIYHVPKILVSFKDIHLIFLIFIFFMMSTLTL